MSYNLMSLNWLKKLSSTVIFLLFFTACDNDSNENQKRIFDLFDVIHKQSPKANVKAIVLIPTVGCTGCISSAEQFMLDNIKKHSNIYFILTGISSKKAFKVRFRDILSNPQVLVDYENVAESKKLSGIYPKIFYMKNGQITKIIESSPSYKGDAWAELKTYLLNEK